MKIKVKTACYLEPGNKNIFTEIMKLSTKHSYISRNLKNNTDKIIDLKKNYTYG